MGEALATAWRVLSRRKTAVCPGDGGQQLRRCLTVVDVTCLGLATSLGTGVYVLVAQGAREHAGPSVVLSILIAAVASCLGGLCYSEVATRFPRGGSAYVYSYATAGEFCALLVGWSMALEYCLGSALAAKSCGQYLDVVTNGTVSQVLRMPLGRLNIPGADDYPDIPAVLVTLLISTSVATTVKLSCSFNNGCVVINILVIVGLVLVSVFHMDAENWTAGPGFFPNGVAGVFSAASLCFYAFLGYDVMATSTGEMVHRSKTLPAAISLVFLVGLVAVFTAATAVTLLVPFSLLDGKGPLLQIFCIRGVYGMAYFVIVGAVAGLVSSLGACIFALSRLLASLAADGLLFTCLSKFDPSSGTSRPATLAAALASSLVALLCDSRTLEHALGMGTLMSFMSVAVAVLWLRYGPVEHLPLEAGRLSRDSSATLPLGSDYCMDQVDAETQTAQPPNDTDSRPVTDGFLPQTERSTMAANGQRDYGAVHRRTLSVEFINESFVTSISELSPQHSKHAPSRRSAATAGALVACMIVVMFMMGVMTLHVPRLVAGSRWWMELFASSLFLAVLVCAALVCRQPRHHPRVANRVPCVPVLPICAIWMDVHLMVGLPYTSWLIFLAWALVGLLLYLSYGLWHSTERNRDSLQDVCLLDVSEDSGYDRDRRESLVENC